MNILRCCIIIAILLADIPYVIAQTLYVPGGTTGASSNANVGIGTSSPGAKLDVRGAGWFTLGGGESLAVNGQGSDTIVQGPNLYFTDTSIGATATVLQQGANGGFGIWTYDSAWGERVHVSRSGNVGIGSTNPSVKFVVDSNGSGQLATSIPFTNNGIGGANVMLRLEDNSGGAGQGNWMFQTRTAGDDFAIANFGDNAVRLLIDTVGNVGIGTSNPGSRLESNGTIRVTGSGTPSTNGGGVEISFNGAVGVIESFNRGVGGTPLYIYGYPACFLGGNVGIGTTNPTQKLSVNGTIRAKEVIVDTGWPDYVFDDGYKLASLSDVEAHIKTEKHLPGIPSAAEVAEQGISVGEMQARLLAKIEELTLHVIAQEKEAKANRREIDEMRSEISLLKRTKP